VVSIKCSRSVVDIFILPDQVNLILVLFVEFSYQLDRNYK